MGFTDLDDEDLRPAPGVGVPIAEAQVLNELHKKGLSGLSPFLPALPEVRDVRGA